MPEPPPVPQPQFQPAEAPAIAPTQPSAVPHKRRPGEPIGDEARWKILYRRALELRPDETLTWEQMADHLGLDPDTDRAGVHQAWRRADRELLLVDKRAMVRVRGVGVRLATAEQQLQLAKRHQTRAELEVRRGIEVADAVDLENMAPSVRAMFEAVGTLFRRQRDVMSEFDVRQQRLARVVDAVQQGQKRVEEQVAVTQDDVAALKEQLAALHAKLDKTP